MSLSPEHLPGEVQANPKRAHRELVQLLQIPEVPAQQLTGEEVPARGPAALVVKFYTIKTVTRNVTVNAQIQSTAG